MKRYLSNGLIITGIMAASLWGTIAILHFFLYAKSEISGVSEWFRSFIEVQNRMAFDPYVIGTLGVCIGALVFLELQRRWKPDLKIPDTIYDIAATILIAIIVWIAIALVNIVAFGKTNPKSLLTESTFYLALFDLLFQFAIVNYVLTFVLFILSGIFGRAILRKLFPDLEFISALQEFLFSTSVGLGLLAIVIFVVGLVHLLYPWVVAIVIFVAMIIGLEGAPSYPSDMRRALAGIRLPPLTWGLFIVLLFIIASSLYAPLIPPFMHDAMNSHLEAPKVFIREHAINFHAYINFNNFPMAIELLYVPMLMIGRVLMTQIMTYFLFLMTVAVVYEFGRVYFRSPTTGMLSAILLCLIPRLVGQFNHPTIDIALTFYIFLAALALAGWWFAGREKYLHLSGLVLGLSLGVKYTALIFVLIYLLWTLIQRLLLENAKLKATLNHIGVILIIAIIVGSPWYLRNLVLFGNPFFPFYQNFFGQILPIGTLSELKPDLRINEKEMLGRFSYEGDWTRIFTFLADVSYTDKTGVLKNQMGPLYIAILPLLALVALSGLGKLIGKYILKWPIEINHSLPAWMCLFVMVVFTSYWIFQVKVLQLRYLFPVMPFMAILAGFALTNLFRLDKVNGRHALAVFLVGCFGMLSLLYFNTGVLHLKVNDLPIQRESRENFLKRYITSYEAVTFVNTFLGPDDIVYGLFCENCRYYANFTLIGGLYGYADHQGFNRHTSTGRELYEYLKNFNCTYLLVDTKRQQHVASHYGAVMLPRDPSFKAHFHHMARKGVIDIYEIID